MCILELKFLSGTVPGGDVGGPSNMDGGCTWNDGAATTYTQTRRRRQKKRSGLSSVLTTQQSLFSTVRKDGLMLHGQSGIFLAEKPNDFGAQQTIKGVWQSSLWRVGELEVVIGLCDHVE